MFNSQEGSLQLAGSHVCPSCGNVTKAKKVARPFKKEGIIFVILGWLSFFVSLMFIPILFGAISLCMGFWVFHDRSKTHGAILMFFAAVGIILGSLISIMVAGTMFI